MAKTIKEFEEMMNQSMLLEEYMDKIASAESLATKKRYLKKALEIKPDDLDLNLMALALDNSSNPIKRLEKIDVMLNKEEKNLEEEGFFKDCMGDFWLAFETRPYMRVLQQKLIMLCFLSRTLDAISLAERMLELCKNDNLGIRYILMKLYAIMLDDKKAKDLYARYKEESAFMLLPLAVLYYRLGQYKECDRTLKKLEKANKYLCPLLIDCFPIDKDGEPSYYSWGSYDEAILVGSQNTDLLDIAHSFMDYLEDKGYPELSKLLDAEE